MRDAGQRGELEWGRQATGLGSYLVTSASSLLASSFGSTPDGQTKHFPSAWRGNLGSGRIMQRFGSTLLRLHACWHLWPRTPLGHHIGLVSCVLLAAALLVALPHGSKRITGAAMGNRPTMCLTTRNEK